MIQERIPKLVYQLQIESLNEQVLGLVRAVLLKFGFKEEELITSSLKGRAALELFSEDKDRFKRVVMLFKKLGLNGVKLHERRLMPKDWLTLWKAQWTPAALTKKMDVVPVWYHNKYKKIRGRDYILMDTLLSFGTGLHETTQVMAQFIEDQKGKAGSFLDIGTGTGILAFVAMKNGAQRVVGIDIGALSVQAAKDNMKANNMYFHVLRADIRKYASKESFDFVAANLVTEDLITHGRKILSFVKAGGLLAVSGISLGNLSKLRKCFSQLPLKTLKVAKGKQWSGILYQKKSAKKTS